MEIYKTDKYLGGTYTDFLYETSSIALNSSNTINKILPISCGFLNYFSLPVIGSEMLGIYKLSIGYISDILYYVRVNGEEMIYTDFTPGLNENLYVDIYGSVFVFLILDYLEDGEEISFDIKHKYNNFNIDNEDEINSENIGEYIYTCLYLYNNSDINVYAFCLPGTEIYTEVFNENNNITLNDKYNGDYYFDSDKWSDPGTPLSPQVIELSLISGYNAIWFRSQNHYKVNEFPQERGVFIFEHGDGGDKYYSLTSVRVPLYSENFYKYFLDTTSFEIPDSDIYNYNIDNGDSELILDTSEYSSGDYFIKYYKTDKYCRTRNYYYFDNNITIEEDGSLSYGPNIPTFTVDMLRDKYLRFTINYDNNNYGINKIDIKINDDIYSYTFSQTTKLNNKIITILASEYDYGDTLNISIRSGRKSVFSAYSETTVLEFLYKSIPEINYITNTIKTSFKNDFNNIVDLYYELTNGNIRYSTNPFYTYLEINGDYIFLLSQNRLLTSYSIVDDYTEVITLPSTLYDDGNAGYYMGCGNGCGLKIDTDNRIIYVSKSISDKTSDVFFNNNIMNYHSDNLSYLLYYNSFGQPSLFYACNYISGSNIKNYITAINQE